ncbi:MAG TPA: hypothetical protein VMF07_14235 [Solirubrobacteraceae bacterium]|nr:hypothetical protein [Solirubrobacteraceae bacterium]
MNWADANGVSYLAWVWLVDDPIQPGDDTCDRFGLLSSYNGTPLAPNGTAVHDHLTALAGGSTTGTSTGSGTTTSTGKRKPPVRLRSFSAVLEPSGRAVKFRLRTAQKCTGRITGQSASRFAVTAVMHKARRVSLGSVKLSLKAGKAKTVVMRLSKTARNLMASKRSLKVRFTITLNSAGHRRTVLHRTVTLHRKHR